MPYQVLVPYFIAIPQWPITTRVAYFSKPLQKLWLRDLSNSIVTLGNPNLNLGSLRHPRPTKAPQANLGTLGPLRYLRPTQVPQAHLGTLGPLRHPRPTQALQAHLSTQGPFIYAYLGALGLFRHPRPIQMHLAHLGSLGPILAHLDPLKFIQSCLGHLFGTSCMVALLHGSHFCMACMNFFFIIIYLAILYITLCIFFYHFVKHFYSI